MERKKIFLILTSFFFSCLIIYFLIDHLYPKETWLINYKVELLNKSKSFSFNLNSDQLHFGKLCSSCRVYRYFTLTNNFTYPIKVKFKIVSFNSSLAQDFTITPPSGTILKVNQNQKFTISLTPSSIQKPQIYSGLLLINIYKAWPWKRNKDSQVKP